MEDLNIHKRITPTPNSRNSSTEKNKSQSKQRTKGIKRSNSPLLSDLIRKQHQMKIKWIKTNLPEDLGTLELNSYNPIANKMGKTWELLFDSIIDKKKNNIPQANELAIKDKKTRFYHGESQANTRLFHQFRKESTPPKGTSRKKIEINSRVIKKDTKQNLKEEIQEEGDINYEYISAYDTNNENSNLSKSTHQKYNTTHLIQYKSPKKAINRKTLQHSTNSNNKSPTQKPQFIRKLNINHKDMKRNSQSPIKSTRFSPEIIVKNATPRENLDHKFLKRSASVYGMVDTIEHFSWPNTMLKIKQELEKNKMNMIREEANEKERKNEEERKHREYHIPKYRYNPKYNKKIEEIKNTNKGEDKRKIWNEGKIEWVEGMKALKGKLESTFLGKRAIKHAEV